MITSIGYMPSSVASPSPTVPLEKTINAMERDDGSQESSDDQGSDGYRRSLLSHEAITFPQDGNVTVADSQAEDEEEIGGWNRPRYHVSAPNEPIYGNELVYSSDLNAPFHINRPSIRAEQELTAVTLDGRTVRMPLHALDEYSKREEQDATCCYGHVSLFAVLMAINVVNMVCGIVSIVVGCVQVGKSSNGVVGFDTPEKMIISGSLIYSCVLLIIGGMLAVCGIFGIIVARRRSRKWERVGGKCVDVSYQSFVVLIILLCSSLIGFTIFAISIANEGELYDATSWSRLTQMEPVFSCETEERLECAGLDTGQCLYDNNFTSRSFCPGHFCVDFCKIAGDVMNNDETCERCHAADASQFVKCKALERSKSASRSCGGLLSDDLKRSYRTIVLAATGCLLSVGITGGVSSYQVCWPNVR